MLQGSRKVQVPCQLFLYLLKPVLSRNTGYVTPPEGFALKQVQKAYRFNKKQREYLTARFTIGQESGKRSTRKLLQQK